MFVIRPLLSLVVILLFLNANAQLEFHKWYFGNQAGINFTTTPPSAIAAANVMTCIDNAATISDSLGNVLFYSNGQTVWNKNNAIMQNGSGLLGQSSGGHSATIVRMPGSSTIYYLFTMDYFGASNGLKYSVIDMSLANGLGAVTAQKNVTLLAPASEQIVPIVHSNGVDVWILAHEWNSAVYKAFLLTSSGISATPVSTTIGTVRRFLSGTSQNQQYGAQGQITVNAANNRIATAYTLDDRWELLDFDNSNGTLSHVRTFASPNYDFAWGIEFSADGSKVYLTGLNSTYVYQFDVTSNNTAAISASATNVGPIDGPGVYRAGYMQRGPDDKIYIAVYDDTYLAVINNPNLSGTACNVIDTGFYLGGKTSSAGVVDKVLVTRPCYRDSTILGSDTALCLGQVITLAAPAGASYRWSNDSTTSSINVALPGTYSVTVTEFGSCTITDAVNVTFATQSPTINLGADRLFCGPVALTLSANQVSQWSTGVSATQISVSQAGTYWAYASNACGVASDTVVVRQSSPPVVDLGADTVICLSRPLVLNAEQTNTVYQWSTGASTSSISVTSSGTYSVTVTNVDGCSATDNVNLVLSMGLTGSFSIVQPSCGSNNGSVTCVNLTGTAPINVQWNTGGANISTMYQVMGLGAGVYFFNAIDYAGCTIDTSFTLVNAIGQVSVSSSADTICSGTKTTICSPTGFDSYLWSNGATTPCITATQAGSYTVTVTDGGGCTAASTALTIYAYPLPPVSVTVNADTMTASGGTTYQWYFGGAIIEGATSSQYIATQNGTYAVVITDLNGCAASSNSINIIRTDIGFIVESDVVVYPNPNVNGTWFVQLGNDMFGAKAEVYDYSGKLVYDAVLTDNINTVSFDAASGVYVLKLKTGSNTITQKLIKL